MLARVARYVIRGGQAGYDRLKLLASARAQDTSDLVDRVGVAPGSHCLDLGCGGGEVTFALAERVGPEGRVTGVDMDDVKLELARSSAAGRGAANVEFKAADVNEWNEPGAYDLVYCRFLLQHLSRPVDLLERMWAAVRAGGAIVVEDSDFDGLFCNPPNAGFAFYADMYPRVLERRGGDATIGRKLHRYFLQAGIPEPALRLVQGVGVTGPNKAIAPSTLEAVADAILAEGLASESEVSAAITDLAAFAADPTTIIGDPRAFQVWCRRS
jgi:ubiquinone/menaquinone biosynthesis C-methylase UbiE